MVVVRVGARLGSTIQWGKGPLHIVRKRELITEKHRSSLGGNVMEELLIERKFLSTYDYRTAEIICTNLYSWLSPSRATAQ